MADARSLRAAFEAFLREKGIPCVAVDEAKRALFANAKLKSFDFVVYSKAGPNLLVDVKGRQLRNRSARRGFETWTTEQDVADLMQWQEVFGQGYKASSRSSTGRTAVTRSRNVPYKGSWTC